MVRHRIDSRTTGMERWRKGSHGPTGDESRRDRESGTKARKIDPLRPGSVAMTSGPANPAMGTDSMRGHRSRQIARRIHFRKQRSRRPVPPAFRPA